MATTVAQGDFEKLFQRNMGVLFNWHAFRSRSWPVDLEIVDGARSFFERAYLPWVRGGRLFDKNARAIRLADVPGELHTLNGASRAKVLELAQAFEQEKRVPLINVPAVRRPDKGTILVMDACHRLSALTLVPTDFVIALFVVRAPRSALTLVDLEVP